VAAEVQQVGGSEVQEAGDALNISSNDEFFVDSDNSKDKGAQDDRQISLPPTDRSSDRGTDAISVSSNEQGRHDSDGHDDDEDLPHQEVPTRFYSDRETQAEGSHVPYAQAVDAASSEASLEGSFESSKRTLMQSLASLDEAVGASRRDRDQHDRESESARSHPAISQRSTTEDSENLEGRGEGESLRDFWDRRKSYGSSRKGGSSDEEEPSASATGKTDAAGSTNFPAHTGDRSRETTPSPVLTDEKVSVESEDKDEYKSFAAAAAGLAAITATGIGLSAAVSSEGEPSTASLEANSAAADAARVAVQSSTDALDHNESEPVDTPGTAQEREICGEESDGERLSRFESETDRGDAPHSAENDLIEPLSDAEPMDDYFGEEPLSEEDDDYYGGYGSVSESSQEFLERGAEKDHSMGFHAVEEPEDDESSTGKFGQRYADIRESRPSESGSDTRPVVHAEEDERDRYDDQERSYENAASTYENVSLQSESMEGGEDVHSYRHEDDHAKDDTVLVEGEYQDRGDSKELIKAEDYSGTLEGDELYQHDAYSESQKGDESYQKGFDNYVGEEESADYHEQYKTPHDGDAVGGVATSVSSEGKGARKENRQEPEDTHLEDSDEIEEEDPFARNNAVDCDADERDESRVEGSRPREDYHEDESENLEPPRLPSHEYEEDNSDRSIHSSVSSVTMLTLEDDPERKAQVEERKRQERVAALAAAGITAGAVAGGVAAAAAERDQAAALAAEQAAATQNQEQDATRDEPFADDEQLRETADERRQRREKEALESRRTARKNLTRSKKGKRGRTYGNDALEELEASVIEARAAFNRLGNHNAPIRTSSKNRLRKSVRSIVKDESDSENERIKEEEEQQRANAVNLVLVEFEQMLQTLLRVSDELVLSSTFRASNLVTDVVNIEALLSLISYTGAIDVAFSEMKPALIDLYPDGERLDNTADGECVARITRLAQIITAVIRRVSERQAWNARSATCYVTALELLERAAGELKHIVDGEPQRDFEVTPQLRRAWTSSGHSAQVSMLEDGPKEDDYYLKLLSMNVLSQMDEWAPSQDDLRFVCCYEIGQSGGRSEDGSGFYSSRIADIPTGAIEVLNRIKGDPLSREDVVSSVLRRLLPLKVLPLNSNSSDDISVLSESVSLKSGSSSRRSGGRRARGGTVISITSIPEDPHDPQSLGIGGVGKTTVAALVVSNVDVRKEYNGGVAWIDVGDRGAYGLSYDEYCDILLSLCKQLNLSEEPSFPELVNVPGESRADGERRESQLMLEARDKVGGLFRGRRGAVLLVLDDVWSDQDLTLFRFRWKKKKLCDIITTSRVHNLMASDIVKIDMLSNDEGIQLLMAESDQPLDHAMATSVEAKAIVRECANHPIAIKIVARWLGLKLATAGVINSVEETHEVIAKTLERIFASTSGGSTMSFVDGDMLYEILDQSLSPSIEGKPTKVIKLCFAAFVLVFCRSPSGLPVIPAQAADELFESILHVYETALFDNGSIFERQFRDATQLIPEALGALGVMKVTTGSTGSNRTSGTLQLNHDTMLEYGDHILTPEGGLGTLVHDAELVWNRAFSSSCLEDMISNHSWDETEPNDGRKYALEFLVGHMIRAEMIQEASVLLRDERYLRGRLSNLGLNKGTKRHVQECEEIYEILPEPRSGLTEPGDFMSRAYEKCGALIRDQLSSMRAAGREMQAKASSEAGFAFNVMGFSLAQRSRWDDAAWHYDNSYELLDLALGDNEIVASILFNRSIAYFESNRCEQAMESLDECLNIRTAISGEQGLLVAQTICKKGDVFAAMSDYPAAMYNYRKGLDIMQVEPNRNRAEIGNTFQAMGRMHREKGEFDQALKLYSEAMRCKKIELGLNHYDLANTYIEMGYCHAESNNREAAEPLFDEAIRLMSQAEPTDENDAELLTIQGIMHNMADEKDEGLECYKQALDILKTKCSEKKGKIAALLNRIANEHVARGENGTAFKLFEESLHVRKGMVGFVHVDVATTLVNMATLQQQRGKYEKALRCLEEALRIRKLRLGDSHGVASTLEMIGNLSKEIGQLKKSEMAYEEALRILRGLYGQGHSSVANVLHEMGDLMDDISEYDEAITNFRESLEIKKRNLGLEHEDVAETLYSMGFAFHNQGEYEESLDCFDDCLQIRRQRYGNDHDLVGDTLNIMGFVESKSGRHEVALRLLEEALTIRQSNGDSLKAADTLKNIGNIHRERQEYDAAIECYDSCLRLRKREVGLEDERVADALLALGNVYSDTNENEEAMHCFTEAYTVRNSLYGDHDDRVASVLQTMGIIEFRAGDTERGRQYLEDFARIRKNNHTEESADYVNALFIIGNIHKIQGRDSLAKEAWAEAYEIFNEIGLDDENPAIAKILTKLLSKKEKGGGSSDSGRKSGVFGRLKSNFTSEKVIKPTKKQPMKDVSSSSSRRLIIE